MRTFNLEHSAANICPRRTSFLVFFLLVMQPHSIVASLLYINLRGEAVELFSPWGITPPACGAPAHSGWLGNGCSGWANISSRRKSRLRKPKTAGKQRKSNNICSKIFDHSCCCAEMGHGCQRLIKHLAVVWLSGISDGPFSPRCQHRSPISKLTMFSAEELKSFVASPLFCSFMMTDCVSLRACRGRSSIRYCACLAETKGYFGLNTSPPHIHRSLCKVIHHL